MTASAPDIHQTLEYRPTAEIVRLLPTGLLLIFLGLFLYAILDPDREPATTFLGIGACFVMGIAVIGIALWNRYDHGRPLFALSPAGIHYRIPWVKELLIPWREVKGIDSIDIQTGVWSMSWSTKMPRYDAVTFRGVTVVLVPKPLYDQKIHIRSFLLRGPGWKANFIPKGALVQIALHHELVSVDPASLRDAVEARWLAFRDQPAVPPTRTSVPRIVRAMTARSTGAAPTTNVVAMGDDPKSMSTWEAIKIIVPLVGIAAVLTNLAGLWELPGQSEERAARAKAREVREYWQESNRRMKEEWKKRDAEEKERQKRFDEDMRRVFGR